MSPAPFAPTLDADAPLRWLAAGWRDFLATWPVSVAYSLGFTVLGFVALTLAAHHDRMLAALPLLTGFMLLAPAPVVGYYRAALVLRQGGQPGFGTFWEGLRDAGPHLWIIAFILGFCFLIWVTDALLIYVFYFGAGSAESWEAGAGGFLLFAGLTGFVLAAGIYSVTAFSVPLVTERGFPFTAAMGASARLVFRHPAATLPWAACIAGLGLLGLLVLPLLPVVLPVLAYASHAAYREVVGTGGGGR